MAELFKEFVGLYKKSITLRASLIPQGKTLEYMEKDFVLEHDKHRAESYIEVKRIMDSFHRSFLEKALQNFSFDKKIKTKKAESEKVCLLQKYYQLYILSQKADSDKKAMKEVQMNMRKKLSETLHADEKYKNLFSEKILSVFLPEYMKSDDYVNETKKRLIVAGKCVDESNVKSEIKKDRRLVAEFNKFSTYFTGFFKNRKNIYVSDAKHTSLAFRIVDENLPRFIDNMRVFSKVCNSSLNAKIPSLAISLQDVLPAKTINEVFELNYYNRLVNQTQIEVYNAVIGGRTLEDGTKLQGLNEYINLYNQQQKDKRMRLPKFQPLYKLILSDRNAVSWLPDSFTTDEELQNAVDACYQEIYSHVLTNENESERSLANLLSDFDSFELNHIFLKNDIQLTNISQQIFGDWSVIKKSIIWNLQQVYPQGKRENDEKYRKKILRLCNGAKSFSIDYLNTCVNKYLKDLYKETSEEKNFKAIPIQRYFVESVIGEDNLLKNVIMKYEDAKNVLLVHSSQKLKNNDADIEKIKNLLDAIKNVQYLIKPLFCDIENGDKDDRFYSELVSYYDTLNLVTPLYNKVRSYVTSKPYSDEKIKLNFDNSTLMGGWDVNKERDNTCVLMRKDGKYYLAIMPITNRKAFKNLPDEVNGDAYEKMDYKFLPGPNKMLPKVFFSKSGINEFKPSAELLQHYHDNTHKKGPQFNLHHCHELIDFFKTSINKHKEWRNFGFKFSPTESYEDLSGFYREVEMQGYKMNFRKVSSRYIDMLVNDGKLYLFQIYNKDFSEFSKGTPNLHTLYWKMLFDDRNLADVVYKLDGNGEVFYRKASLDYKLPTHPANKPISNKNPLNEKKQSIFKYDLMKNRRYTMDHFQLHIPITMNFKSSGTDNINALAQEAIRKTSNVCVIGLDRGERHLLYLTVVDHKGCIKEQYTLNEIVNEHKGNTYRTNYHNLLQERESERDDARKNWKTIEGIAELKEGYLSQVIHKIVQLMIKYNAIVVLEDLNFGFKRGRQKVERQVYQKFEKMLIDKLNYLVVDKKSEPTSLGGLLKAYQLTSKVDNMKRLGKQCGFLFYVDAWNTSKIDPKTGFVNMLDTSYTNIDQAQDFFRKFDSINFNADKNWFELTFDYSKFGLKTENTRERWTLCTYGTRIITYRNPEQNNIWDNKELNLTDEFKNFFDLYGIDYQCENLQERIVIKDDKSFFEGLYRLLKLTLQMRNSKINSEVDYVLSPVMSSDGTFYDSRECDKGLPENADANGAYNIARKGLMIIDKIRSITESSKGDNISLAISHKEWLYYAQKHHD